MLNLNLTIEGFTPEFLTNLEAADEDHPNEDTTDDGSSPTYPDQPDIDRDVEISGDIIQDLVPERFLTDVSPNMILLESNDTNLYSSVTETREDFWTVLRPEEAEDQSHMIQSGSRQLHIWNRVKW